MRNLYLLCFAILMSLLAGSSARAQEAYGYASIDIDPNTNTGTGYAMTELDYSTSAYYNAVVDAHIEDQNGNVITSGSNEAYQTAVVTLGFGDVLQCITYRIISYLILDAIIFDDCGYVDVFGFGYLGFDTWWGWGDFYNDRWLCRWERFIRIAQIIETVTDCITAHVSCSVSWNRILPSLNLRGTPLRQGRELQFITLEAGMTSSNNATISCWAMDDFNQPVSNVLMTFSFNSTAPNLDDGGHQNHTGVRPRGTINPTSTRTNGVGNAQTTFTSPPFSGSVDIDISANGSHVDTQRMTTVVPNLQQLFGGTNYMLIGGAPNNNYHPSNHWVKPDVITSLQQIADDYAGQAYPNGFPPHTPEPNEAPTDYYKLHYNDCSLRLGGKFDIRPVPPRWSVNDAHDEHRVGVNCDVRDRNVPNDMVIVGGTQQSRWTVLNQVFFNRGSTGTQHETNPPHWHLRFYRGAQVAASENLTPYNGTPATIPGQIQAEEFDIGDYGNAFYVPPPADPNDDEGSSVDTYDASDGSTALMSVSGQWTAYTVNIDSSDTYTLTARVASPYSGSVFHVEVDGVNKTGSIYIPNTGSWDAYQFVSVDNILLDTGQHVMTLVIDGVGSDKGNFDYFILTPTPPAPDPCQLSSWELNECRSGGGYWDYSSCTCIYAAVWTDTDIAVGADNLIRSLWDRNDGAASLWTVASDGTFQSDSYGPYSGWTAKAMAVGADNLTRVLWTHTSGLASLWIAANGTFQSNVYGPYEGWTATDIGVGNDNLRRVLWTNTDGRISLWVVAADGTLQSNLYGPYAGWTARKLAVGSDNKFRVLWKRTDGAVSLWVVQPDGSFQGNVYGPYAGWTGADIAVGSDGLTRMLWKNSNGSISVWMVQPDNTFQSNLYGPYAGWTVRSIAVGPDNQTRVLWNNVDGRAGQWVVAADGTWQSNIYGPY